MTRISDRLEALERRKASRRVINGLAAFYDLIATTDAVGGGRVLLDRLDAGTDTDTDTDTEAEADRAAPPWLPFLVVLELSKTTQPD